MKNKPTPGEIRLYGFLHDIYEITRFRSNGNDVPVNPCVNSNIQLLDSDLSIYRIHIKDVDIENLGSIYRRCASSKDADFILIVCKPEYRNVRDCDITIQLKFTSSTADRILLRLFNRYHIRTTYLLQVIENMYSEIWPGNAPLEEFL